MDGILYGSRPQKSKIVTKPKVLTTLYPENRTTDEKRTLELFSKFPDYDVQFRKGIKPTIENVSFATMEELNDLRAIKRIDYRINLRTPYKMCSNDGRIEFSWDYNLDSDYSAVADYFVLYPLLCPDFNKNLRRILGKEKYGGHYWVENHHEEAYNGSHNLVGLHQDCLSCPSEMKVLYGKLLKAYQWPYP